MSGLDELSPPDEDRRPRRGRLTPRLRFDCYLLVWETPPARDLRTFNAVPPRRAQRVLQHWFRHGSRFFWRDAQRFYCKMRNQPRHELTEFRKSYIERWFLKQLDTRRGHIRLLKRKPMEFTGRFMEQAPEEPQEESPSDADAYIDLVLVNTQDHPVPRKLYKIEFSDGQVIQGHVDSNGHAHHDAVAAGQCTITLPELDESMLASE